VEHLAGRLAAGHRDGEGDLARGLGDRIDAVQHRRAGAGRRDPERTGGRERDAPGVLQARVDELRMERSIVADEGNDIERPGARCFVRFVRDRGLTDKDVVRVETMNTLLELRLQPDGRVTVDMSAPVFELDRIPFEAKGLVPQKSHDFELWPLDLGDYAVAVAVLSMGNPHAVQIVTDVDHAPVALQGPVIESHARFPRRVNAGFMQVVTRGHIRLRVHERGAGETLACGTGACAAVVAGIRLGLLDSKVDVDTHGGRLTIEWAGGTSHVLMTGPAETVFEGEIEL